MIIPRTELTTSEKINLASSSIAMQGEYGAITDLAIKYGVCRNTVYQAQKQTYTLLEKVIEEKEPLESTIMVDRRQLERAIIALRTVGQNTLRSIEDLLPILYPGLSPSYGKIQAIIKEGEAKARGCNEQIDLSSIIAGALDEMFSQGSPVLAGIDLDSSYLFALSLNKTRKGKDWQKLFQKCKEQGLNLQIAVKDAAKGIAEGVREVFPDAEQRDDCFHAIFKMSKVHQILERKAYSAIYFVEDLQLKLDQAKKRNQEDVRSLAQKLRHAKECCEKAIELFDTFEAAMKRVREAMEIVNLEQGIIRTAEWIQSEIEKVAEVMLALENKRCRKVGRYLKNRAPGLALYAKELNTKLFKLSTIHGEAEVTLASIIVRLLSDLCRNLRPWDQRQDQRHLAGAVALLKKRAGDNFEAVFSEVNNAFQHRHRASSAIEGFNAALRPHLYIQKGVTQEFLELFRFYYNHRKRRWGRHKGTSAHEKLTGQYVEDWLTLLGYPPTSSLLN